MLGLKNCYRGKNIINLFKLRGLLFTVSFSRQYNHLTNEVKDQRQQKLFERVKHWILSHNEVSI